MFSSSTHSGGLTSYAQCNDSPSQSPDRHPSSSRLKTLELPHATRPTSQCSLSSCSSTLELVDHKENRGSSTSFTGRIFSFRKRKEKLHDAEKLEAGTQNRDCDADPSEPVLRAWHGWKLVFFGSWWNVLILLIPASWVLKLSTSNSHTLIFTFCVLAMIPLVKLHDLATKDLSIRLGESKTGLLNATMSNTVETVVAVTALRKCELRVVQSSLIGSMLSKLLLILGMCFFAGGLRFTEQDFDSTATQIHSSLLSISVGAVLLPAAFHFALTYSDEDALEAGTSLEIQKRDLLRMSHGVSFVLLFIYASYLLFQFWSHTHLFKDSRSSSDKLQSTATVRTFASRLRRKSLSTLTSKANSRTSSPVIKTAKLPANPTDLNTFVSRPDIPDLQTPPRSTTPSGPFRGSIDAYLVSPFAASSQVTVTDLQQPMPPSSTNSLVPEDGCTVRLVRTPEPIRRRRPSSASDQTVNWGGNEDKDRWAGEQMAPVYSSDLSTPAVPRNGDETTAQSKQSDQSSNTEEEEQVTPVPKVPKLSWTLTLFLMSSIAVLVGIDAEWMVDSMDNLSPAISKEWIGLILLPTVASIAECITAVNVSVKDQLTLSISVAVGSTIQTALLVIPLMVILGWIIDKPLALLFDPFQSVVLYISVNTMGYVVADGRSNWLEGVILVCLYVVIAVTFWFYPGSSFSSNLAVCSTSLA